MNDQKKLSLIIETKISGTDLKQLSKDLKNVKKETEEINKKTSNLASSKDIEKIGNQITNAINPISFKTIVSYASKFVNKMSEAINVSATYLENMNLLDVAYKNDTTSAKKFVNTLSEMYGLDESWGYRTVGIFKQLSNAMGLADETGQKVANTLTQLAIDTSSLYNIDVNDTSSIIQSALAGQTKPARRLGADITQNTLQQVMDSDNLGINVQNLSFAEKRLVIIVSLLRQTKEAQNDWGRTIESVANQTRIMEQQWVRLKRSVGNVGLVLYKQIVPYLNAILMVLSEVIQSIAIMLGYKEEDFDYFGGATQSITDLDDAITSATEDSKKLKQGLRSFDKLNNITTPSSGSGGTGSGTGINPKILEWFNKENEKYQQSLEKVKMKATEIRDKIMEWLGYTKLTDEETGEVTFKLKEGYSNLKLIGAIIGTIGIAKVVKLFSRLFATVKGTTLVTTLGKLAGKTKIIAEYAKDFGKEGFTYALGETAKPLAKAATKFGNVALGIGGVIVAADGLKRTSKAMKDFGNQTKDNSEALKKYAAGATETIGGLALTGYKIAGLPGALTGIIVAAAATTVTAIKSYKKGLTQMSDESEEKFKNIEENFTSFSKSIQSLKIIPSAIIDDKTKKKVLNSMKNLVTQIKTEVKKQKEQTISDINEMVTKGFMSTDEAQKAVNWTTATYKLLEDSTSNGEERITTIIENANKEKRALTDNERIEIESIYNQLKENTIDIVTSSTTEQTILYERLTDKEKELSLQAASELIGNAINIKDETIKAADEQYKETLNKADNMKKIGAINQETYDKIKTAAKETRDKTVEEAEKQYSEIYDGFVKNNEDIAGYIDRDDGHIKSKWTKFWEDVGDGISDTWTEFWDNWKVGKDIIIDWFKRTSNSISEWLAEEWKEFKKEIKEKYADIKKDFKENVLVIFTKDYWSKKLENIKSSISNFKFPKIKLNVSYDSNVGAAKKAIYKALGLDGWPKLSVSTYARGGIPKVGQMFVANERGPELVGQIGGQSFVANQNQMMSLLDKKIGNTQGKGQQIFNIYLDENHKLGSYTLDQLQDMARSNGEPITIG